MLQRYLDTGRLTPGDEEDPQPDPALPTLAEVDSAILVCHDPKWTKSVLERLLPLVEDKACQDAINKAGCWWKLANAGEGERIEVGPYHNTASRCFATWPEARAWAEAQAAKREEAQWSPEVTDGMWEDDVCERVCDVLAYCHPRGRKDPAWLCGRASAMGRYDHERLRIWLGKGDMPKTT
jgi:hypothetical protein